MWLSILGLLIASATALVSVVTGDETKANKRIFIVLTVAGFVVGLYAAIDGERTRQEEVAGHAREVATLNAQLTAANGSLDEVRRAQAAQDPLLRYVTASVGDLGSLNALSGGHKYLVRIAAANNDRGRADLEAAKARIESEFKGATASGMVDIIPLSKGSLQLVFGRHLSFAAAEVYLRLAVSHHLGNGQPQIFSEQ